MSSTARNQVFSAVQTVGSLLPADMLVRISEGKDVTDSTPTDYGIVGIGSVRDEAERHWDYLKGAWRVLRDKLPEAATATADAPVVSDPTGLAISNWLEPLFAELGFGRLQPAPAPGIACDDKTKTFPISHLWAHVPIHLVPWNADLDRKPSTSNNPGAATTTPPQSLVQELLNRTDAHLWAVLSNGRQLRLLRDSASLVGASYVEFDLEAIFDGELFSEFVLLYRLLHVSRFEVEPGAAPTTCRLEKWRTEAIDTGTRALEQLRDGVQRAITSLGTGFTQNTKNTALRENLDSNQLKKALLRLVYRMLFLFVAEDRDVLIPATADPKARERYERYFSTARLRETARRTLGTSHGDRWETLRHVLDHLRNERGFPALGLPGLGGIFEHNDTDAILDGAELSNEALLAAVRSLSVVYDPKAKRNRVIDYRHLGAEELGSIYESLLELVPKYDPADRSFQLVELAGNERKTTGSYYTPTSLIDCLLDSALDPVLDKLNGDGASLESMLLDVRVCDPACGSGHFLVAAARRIAKRLAAVREGNPEPTLDAVRAAMRDVVAKCIYGVDLNPMAVELAKVSLWLEALEPGKPLGFLDAHIKQGNSLLGTTPRLLADGVPDDAFKPIEGDDKKWAAALRKQNEKERAGQDSLIGLDLGISVGNVELARSVEKITGTKADALADVHRQEAAFHDWEQSKEYRERKLVADAWCSAFVWVKKKDAPPAVTDTVLKALDNPTGSGVAPETRREIERIAKEYEFFHWHVEFPGVFHVPESGARSADVDEQTGWSGGFSCVLGNPPWEHLELKEQEFFSAREPDIAAAAGARRKRLIDELPVNNRDLADEFNRAKRLIDGVRHFSADSGRYPLCGRGRIKTDAVFAELGRTLIAAAGRFGMILPTSIATDATTQYFFRDLVQSNSIVSLYDFENRLGIFPAIDSRMKFALLTVVDADAGEADIDFSFFLHDVAELAHGDRHFTLTPTEILLLNPNTGTAPTFRTDRDARISLRTASAFGPLRTNKSSGPYRLQIRRIFNMGLRDVYDLCRRELVPQAGSVVMLESKLTHAYNHRFATYVAHDTDSTCYLGLNNLAQPDSPVSGRYSIEESELEARIGDIWAPGWLLAWADVSRSTDERTLIAAIIPRVATDFTLRVGFPGSPADGPLLLAAFNSFAVDFLLRLRQGGLHVSDYILEQLPIPQPIILEPCREFIEARVLELTYTAYDMEPFARDLGDSGAPFRWSEDRRFLLRAELDALFFHLYGIARDDVDYIMETFPIVKRKDIAAHGTYRTREQILAIYDAMATADASGSVYRTVLDPAPGFGPRHPARDLGAQA